MIFFSNPFMSSVYNIFRLHVQKMEITRNPASVARYTMIKHTSDEGNPFNYYRWALVFFVISLGIKNNYPKVIEPWCCGIDQNVSMLHKMNIVKNYGRKNN